MSRILIVDDQSMVASHLERMLQGLGYNVVGKASSGEEAVDKFSDYDPDIILMDIVMPGTIDGITAAEIIKKKKNIPVVFLTAFPDDLYIERAAKTYASGFLIKPVNKRSIKAAVEIALCTRERDVTPQMPADAAEGAIASFVESEPLMKELLDFTDYALILIDGSGTIKLNNCRSGSLLEKISDKFPETNTNLAEYLPAIYIQVFKTNLSKALSGEQVYVERKFSSRKGKDLWLGVRYIPLTIKEQYVRFVLITARVITGEKDTAPSHENKPSQYSATINTMYDPLFVIDTNFRMEFCNESFIKWMSPLNLKINILNKNLFKVLPFFDAEMQKDYENVIETGEPSILKEQWMIRGISFFFEIVKIPVLENGITARVITLIRDLTGIREMERTMQNMLFRQITKKEYEILRCIARGFSRKEIAKEMNIACATYDKHLQNIKKKLNVFTRSGLIRIADSIIHD